VLRPGGWLALIYPGPEHLGELNRRLGLIRHHQHKDRHYGEAAEKSIGPCTVARIVRRTVMDGATIRHAVLMGPNARHLSQVLLHRIAEPQAVTVDLTILFACKRGWTR
jgi:hypothetical protein